MFAASAVGWTVTVVLIVYLDLRVHALRQTADLPATTPTLLGLGHGFSGPWKGIDLPVLYSRDYRTLDAHTRRFVPVVRVTLPLSPLLLMAAILA